MSERCPFERDIIRAADLDAWNDALREHLDTCDDCSAAAAVAPWIGRFARVGDREHRLPDASVVWLKAKLFQGNIDAARATRPLDFLQMVAYLVVAGGWAALLTWRWEAFAAWLRHFTPAGLVETAAYAESFSMSFFALLFVLASMTVMLAVHTIVAEE